LPRGAFGGAEMIRDKRLCAAAQPKNGTGLRGTYGFDWLPQPGLFVAGDSPGDELVVFDLR
jgi:hypothetical protein